jgi:two-component sensor histidine kinase
VLVPTDKAVVLALVVTELLTNAVKYAYRGHPGRIDVMLKEVGTGIRVVVKDQGVGIGEAPRSGLGSRLTRSLIAQLEGEIQIAAGAPGTSVTLTVPLAVPTSATPHA